VKVFNTKFKMVVDPEADDIGGRSEQLILGTDTRFIFGQDIIRVIGPDVNVAYHRASVRYFEAEAL